MRQILALSIVFSGCAAGTIDYPVEDGCVDGNAACEPGTVSLAAASAEAVSADDAVVAKTASSSAVSASAPTRGAPIVMATDLEASTYGIRIRDERRKKPRSIYSVKMSDLRPDETVELFGEVMVSFCDDKDRRGDSSDADVTPCTGAQMQRNPYTYTPRVSAAFVVSDGPRPDGRRVGAWAETNCHREKHHCTVVLPRVTLTDLPAGQDRWLHLVVTADARGRDAKSWHVMEVEHGKGRLTVARLKDTVTRLRRKETTDLLATGRLGVDQTPDEGDNTQVQRIVYRQALNNLKKGDLVTATSKMYATLSQSNCDPLISTQLLFTEGQGVREPDEAERRLTAKNGFNCRAHGSGACTYRKSGAVLLTKQPARTTYVTLVAMAKRSCAAPNGGDKWWLDAGRGGLEVEVFRAE